MPCKFREVRAQLHREGLVIDRQSGSHQTWVHPDAPGPRVTLAGKDGADVRPYVEQVRDAVGEIRRILAQKEER